MLLQYFLHAKSNTYSIDSMIWTTITITFHIFLLYNQSCFFSFSCLNIFLIPYAYFFLTYPWFTMKILAYIAVMRFLISFLFSMMLHQLTLPLRQKLKLPFGFLEQSIFSFLPWISFLAKCIYSASLISFYL